MIKSNYEKSSILKEDLKVTTAHVPNSRVLKCMKQKLEELKGKKKTNPQKRQKLDILTPWISIWKKTRQKD